MNDSTHRYFITATITDWIQLFQEPSYAQIILQSLGWHRENYRLFLFAYVVMPSHWHAIIKPIDMTIGMCLQSLGSYTAHQIIKLLKSDGRSDVLSIFQLKKRDKRSQYSVWQEIFSENIFSEKFLKQKMEYVHNNPVAKKKLCGDRADYLYSSACYYDLKKEPIIKIDDVNDYLCS